MSKWDKIMMWVVIFIVLFFGIGVINKLFLEPKSASHPKPVATVTATPHPKSTDKASTEPTVYVVENTANGYIWWLDSTGGPFTRYTAEKFVRGHSTYHVYILRKV